MRWCVLLAVCLGACAGDKVIVAAKDPDSSRTCVLLGVTAKPAWALLQVGDTLRVSASNYNCGNPDTASSHFRWTSSSVAIAEVDSLTGLVRAKSAGTVTISVSLLEDRTLRGASLVQVR